MIWFVLILALALGAVVGLFTRNLRKALTVGLATFVVGTALSLLIIFSGAMGG